MTMARARPGQVLGEQPDFPDDVVHLGHPVGLVLKQVEIVQSLGDDIVHGGPLVQGGGGVLEDHLGIANDLPVQTPGDFAGDSDALVEDFTGRAGVDPDYRTANGRLAGAGLTDEGKGLPLVNVEGGVFHRLKGLISLAEGDVHILQGDQNFLAGRRVNGAMLRKMFGSCLLRITHDA